MGPDWKPKASSEEESTNNKTNKIWTNADDLVKTWWYLDEKKGKEKNIGWYWEANIFINDMYEQAETPKEKEDILKGVGEQLFGENIFWEEIEINEAKEKEVINLLSSNIDALIPELKENYIYKAHDEDEILSNTITDAEIEQRDYADIDRLNKKIQDINTKLTTTSPEDINELKAELLKNEEELKKLKKYENDYEQVEAIWKSYSFKEIIFYLNIIKNVINPENSNNYQITIEKSAYNITTIYYTREDNQIAFKINPSWSYLGFTFNPNTENEISFHLKIPKEEIKKINNLFIDTDPK